MAASTYQSFAIVSLFLVIIAAAFGGSPAADMSIHQECEDGIDNNGNFDIDIGDIGCFEYPYADGNGEDPTPMNERYTRNVPYPSLFDYHIENTTPGPQEEAVVCSALGFGLYNSEDSQSASEFVATNGIDCSPYIP